jgi:hypothetical protein
MSLSRTSTFIQMAMPVPAVSTSPFFKMVTVPLGHVTEASVSPEQPDAPMYRITS